MKCYIYKIWKDNKDEVYIGSTSNFKTRMRQHKCKCNNEKSKEYNYFIYQYIRQNGDWEEFNKEIIFECVVEDKSEKLKIEGEWIKKYEKTLNKYNSYGCKDIKENNKKYREKNKEKIKYINKEYYEQNKDKLKEEMKEYYEKNKDKIKEKAKQKVKCPECNKELTKGNLTRHIKSKHTKANI